MNGNGNTILSENILDLILCKEPFVDDIKVALKVTRLYFMVLIYDFITSKTL